MPSRAATFRIDSASRPSASAGGSTGTRSPDGPRACRPWPPLRSGLSPPPRVAGLSHPSGSSYRADESSAVSGILFSVHCIVGVFGTAYEVTRKEGDDPYGAADQALREQEGDRR